MGDLLPMILPCSQRVHAAPLWGAPALCRPEGPMPHWYSPNRWDPSSWIACPSCAALATATDELDRIESEVAGW